jgi:hypothetical protein
MSCSAAPAARQVSPLRPLFNGKSITGWKVAGGSATYEARDGMIVGSTAEGSPNSFFVPPGFYDDFELIFDVKVDDALNSGVQFRSHVYEQDTPQASQPKRIRPAGTVYGYQVEISVDGNAGNVWDEARHTQWHDTHVPPEAKQAFKRGEWNHYRLIAQGDHIRTWVNGVKVADFHDSEDRSGIFGFQVHSIKPGTGPYHVYFKNILLRELPAKPELD